MARAFVVVGEAAGRSAHLEVAGGNLEPVRRSCPVRRRGRLATGQPAQEERLAHRLRVLELVEDDEVVQLARADPLQHVERPCADLLEVLERLLAIE